MSGKTIGLNFNHGYAGSYARQPDMVINTKPNVGSAAIPFGAPVMQASGGVKFPAAGMTAAQFVGVASRQIQTSANYFAQNDAGQYNQNDAVPVFQVGRINVKVGDGTPALYGDVYVRLVASGTKQVGDFECDADATSGNSVKLENCQWGGPKDANGVAELVIFTGIGA
jgi:hypothetical protein